MIKERMTKEEAEQAFSAGKFDNNGGKAEFYWFGQDGLLYVERYYREIYQRLAGPVCVNNEFVRLA